MDERAVSWTSSEDDEMEKKRCFFFFFLSTGDFLCLFLKQNRKLHGEMHVNLVAPRTLSPNGFFYMFLKKVIVFTWGEKQTKVVCMYNVTSLPFLNTLKKNNSGSGIWMPFLLFFF